MTRTYTKYRCQYDGVQLSMCGLAYRSHQRSPAHINGLRAAGHETLADCYQHEADKLKAQRRERFERRGTRRI